MKKIVKHFVSILIIPPEVFHELILRFLGKEDYISLSLTSKWFKLIINKLFDYEFFVPRKISVRNFLDNRAFGVEEYSDNEFYTRLMHSEEDILDLVEYVMKNHNNGNFVHSPWTDSKFKSVNHKINLIQYYGESSKVKLTNEDLLLIHERDDTRKKVCDLDVRYIYFERRLWDEAYDWTQSEMFIFKVGNTFYYYKESDGGCSCTSYGDNIECNFILNDDFRRFVSETSSFWIFHYLYTSSGQKNKFPRVSKKEKEEVEDEEKQRQSVEAMHLELPTKV